MRCTMATRLRLTAGIIPFSCEASATIPILKIKRNSCDLLSILNNEVAIEDSGLPDYDSQSMSARVIAQDTVTTIIGIPFLIYILYGLRKNIQWGKLSLAVTIGYFLLTHPRHTFPTSYNPYFFTYTAHDTVSLLLLISLKISLHINHLLTSSSEKFSCSSVPHFLFSLKTEGAVPSACMFDSFPDKQHNSLWAAGGLPAGDSGIPAIDSIRACGINNESDRCFKNDRLSKQVRPKIVLPGLLYVIALFYFSPFLGIAFLFFNSNRKQAERSIAIE